jgi:hypothetical protein
MNKHPYPTRKHNTNPNRGKLIAGMTAVGVGAAALLGFGGIKYNQHKDAERDQRQHVVERVIQNPMIQAEGEILAAYNRQGDKSHSLTLTIDTEKHVATVAGLVRRDVLGAIQSSVLTGVRYGLIWVLRPTTNPTPPNPWI